MKLEHVTAWVEAHPGESIAIGAVGVIGLLWLLGAFSKPAAQPASDGGASLAAAYYAAEAQQAVVGGQIQQTTIATAAQTAQTKIAADAAVAVNAQNANASVATTTSNNATAFAIADSGNKASLLHDFMGTVLPAEFAAYGSQPIYTYLPGVGGFDTSPIGSPDQLRSGGYSEAQIASMFAPGGFPGIPAGPGPTSYIAVDRGGPLIPTLAPS